MSNKYKMQIKYVIDSAKDYGVDVKTEVSWFDDPGGFVCVKEFNPAGEPMGEFNMSPERARLVAEAILKLTEMV